MAVGDSITAAPWYRRALKADLDRAGYKTDFVGTQFAGDPKSGFTDGEHEGYSGFPISGVTDVLNRPDKGALARFRPDLILLQIGTNDVGRGELDGADARLEFLLTLLLRTQPQARILVATIPPILPFARGGGYGRFSRGVPIYNEMVKSLVSRYSRKGAVHLADIYPALPPTKEYFTDGVHPSGYGVAPQNDGYKRLGDAWFAAIVNVLKKK